MPLRADTLDPKYPSADGESIKAHSALMTVLLNQPSFDTGVQSSSYGDAV